MASSVGLLRRVPVQESGAILGPVDPDPGAQDSPPPRIKAEIIIHHGFILYVSLCMYIHICLYIYTHTDTGIVCPANILVTHFE